MKKFLLVLFIILLTSCSTQTNPGLSQKKENREKLAQEKLANADLQLGFTNLDRLRIPVAKEKFLNATKVAPDYPPVWYALAYFEEATGDKELARTYYLRALKLAPHSGDTNNNYGTFLCRNHEYKAAIDRFLVAASDPDYTDTGAAYENAGLCALKIPNREIAKGFFQKSIREDPTRDNATLELAKMAYAENDLPDARAYLKRYQKLSSPTQESILLERRLG